MNDIKNGTLLIGEVTNVKPYALFLSFEDGRNGLLHISEINDGYIRDIEKYGVVGDKIKVKVIAIDEKNGFLRVSIKQVPENERYTTHDNVKKVTLKTDEKGFQSLKEALPKWIDDTLKKEKKENDQD